ncbi:hypothetical protein BpHYR1_036122 [Brachionus plicatilis]|uniref:Uncharacterized protein n=1 Tax=Brachionus plicatilis TaxID=10195 RepID=A0A3M7S606_BRAPC|nr:hypothetical protein BpHYR1_036122 [Brachionus plicatilis]
MQNLKLFNYFSIFIANGILIHNLAIFSYHKSQNNKTLEKFCMTDLSCIKIFLKFDLISLIKLFSSKILVLSSSMAKYCRFRHILENKLS